MQIPHSDKPIANVDLTFSGGTLVGGRYTIEEQIGKGGMGVVYRAQDTLIGEVVALKFMRPQYLQTQRGHTLFIKEAQIARRLRHENIVAVHDVGTTEEGILYLSMELLKGQSLRRFLRSKRERRSLLEVRMTINIMSQVLSALEHAHRIVVHRDIKPENIMMLSGELVKVLDFGLAEAVEIDDESAGNDAKEPGKKLSRGTLAYAAPEQRTHHDVDHRADLYAAGLVFYELLTLRTPIDAHVPVAKVRDDISPSLVTVLERSIKPQRELRWQTAADFRRELLQAYDESYRAKQTLRIQIVTSSEGEDKEVSTEGMTYLEGGRFLMGNDGEAVEAPEMEVEVDPFYMDAHPVTNRQYAVFLRETGRTEPKFWRIAGFNGENQPVVGVTWADAAAYATWAGKDLPTETQWEFAARGRSNRKYPWGNEEPNATRSNYGDFLNMPSVVDMHEDGGTPEGIHDLAGNVYEWTSSHFTPYKPIAQREPQRFSAPRIAVRGGSWHSPSHELRCAFRKGLFPESEFQTVGFRCVLSIKERK